VGNTYKLFEVLLNFCLCFLHHLIAVQCYLTNSSESSTQVTIVFRYSWYWNDLILKLCWTWLEQRGCQFASSAEFGVHTICFHSLSWNATPNGTTITYRSVIKILFIRSRNPHLKCEAGVLSRNLCNISLTVHDFLAMYTTNTAQAPCLWVFLIRCNRFDRKLQDWSQMATGYHASAPSPKFPWSLSTSGILEDAYSFAGFIEAISKCLTRTSSPSSFAWADCETWVNQKFDQNTKRHL
jgi:hypothetical protein